MGEIITIIDRSKDLTVNTAKGKISTEDMINAVRKYLLTEPTSRVLWNFLEADASGVSGSDLNQFQKSVNEQPGSSKKRKIAVVVSRKFGYGLCRQSETYAELEGIPAKHHIVYKLDEAMAWLDSDRDD